jgi:hypothetical protein
MSDTPAANDAPQVGFAADIKPLFREKDRDSMRRAFDLWSRDDVFAHGQAIATHLSDGTMPCDGRWPEQQVKLFETWLAQGGKE